MKIFSFEISMKIQSDLGVLYKEVYKLIFLYSIFYITEIHMRLNTKYEMISILYKK